MKRDLPPLLKTNSNETLSVGYIQLRHLYSLGLKRKRDSLKDLHLLLLRTWIANAEENLSKIVSQKQPICLVATEGNSLIASIIIKPINRRGTCWSISLPNIYENSQHLLVLNSVPVLQCMVMSFSLINSSVLVYLYISLLYFTILQILLFFI